jgi:hypothetical protein
MTPHVVLNAIVGLALMLAVIAAYLVLARRFRLLWHPLSIVVAVGTVSVVVAIVGELLFRGGWAGVPSMVRRSAIGGFGWGVIIAPVVWAARRLFIGRRK